MRRLSPILYIVVVLAFAAPTASVQEAAAQSPGATVLQLNQQAMTAYSALQISRALELLTQAEAICRQYRVGGMALARTYANMGMVEAGGMSNNAAAMQHFKLAVCWDPTINLDPLSSTPDIDVLFNMARAQAQAPGACAGVQAAQPMPAPSLGPQPSQQPGFSPQAPPVAIPMQLTRHQPVPQQARLVPVPIFVEVNPNVQVAQVALFYRTLGERVFQQLVMAPLRQGYAATIGCDVLQTFDPTGIEYYIAVYGPNQQLLGTSGTESQPHQVAIVPQLSGPEPSLPGLPPPERCVEECPPWNSDCNKSCKRDSAMCDSSAECCAGYACVNEMCTPSGNNGDNASGDRLSHVRIPLVIGTGFGVVPAEERRAPGQVAPGDLSLASGTAWDKLHLRLGVLFNLSPDLLLGLTFRGDLALDPDTSPLRPAFIANFGYRLLGKDSSQLELWSVFGLGGGLFQHRVSYLDCPTEQDIDSGEISCVQEAQITDPDTGDWTGVDGVEQVFFRKAGYFIVEAGVDANFWFKKGGRFGWNLGLIIDLLLAPDFALNFDLQSGPVLRF